MLDELWVGVILNSGELSRVMRLTSGCTKILVVAEAPANV